MSDDVIYHKCLKRVSVDFKVIRFRLFTTTVAVYLTLGACGHIKGEGILFKSINVCTYLYTCNVLKLLLQQLAHLSLILLTRKLSATGWDDCTHALFRTSKIRMQCIIPA